MWNRISITICTFLVALSVFAQSGVKATLTAPSTASVGENFRLQYTINLPDVEEHTRLSSIDGFDVVSGPNTSVFSSMSSINGRTTTQNSITVTYILNPHKVGNYVLPSITFRANGKSYKTNAHRIKVVSTKANNNTTSSANDAPDKRTYNNHLDPKDFFITVTANKRAVYEQEPVTVTYKVYTRLNLSNLVGNMPNLNGFVTQEVPLPQNKSYTTEEYNGRLYRVVTWSQYVLFPQQTGRLVVPPITFEGIVTRPDERVDPLDAFFNGADALIDYKVSRTTKPIDIQVSALPANKPQNFSGGVGQFSLHVDLLTENPKTNEPLEVRVKLEGQGNHKLIKAPIVKFPAGFDTYDTKSDIQTTLGREGLSGVITFDYLAVPRTVGTFEIPPIEFVYFDSATKQFRTLRSSPIKFNVTKGSNMPLTADQLRAKNDVSPLMLQAGKTYGKASGGMPTFTYVLCHLVIIILFAVLFFILRRQLAARTDLVRVKGRKAYKQACKALQKAKTEADAGNAKVFYDSLMKTLQHYVSDRFNLTVTELDADAIVRQLENHQYEPEVQNRVKQLLQTCQYAVYAGTPQAEAMHADWAEASALLALLEKK